MRPREERSGEKKTATAEPPLANRDEKEAKSPAMALASGAVVVVAPIKRSRRVQAATGVGN
jgi:hypothetical protein